MPDWIPKSQGLRGQLMEELAAIRVRREQAKQQFLTGTLPKAQTMPGTYEPIVEPEPAQLAPTVRPPVTRPAPLQRVPVETPVATERKAALAELAPPVTRKIPFWQRALEVFSAPFEWVDKNIIKPAAGGLRELLDPDLAAPKREPGEDFWAWKRRSWESWQSPELFTLNLPWGEWTVDLKGVVEFAPWLLVPGAGQVGGALLKVGALAARAGMAGRAVSAGLKVVGKAVQYSPWGLVEKGTGAALGRILKTGGAVGDRLGAKLSRKVFGETPEAAMASPTVQRFTKHMEETVFPAFKKWQKEGEPALRARQEATARAWIEKGRTGEISKAEAALKAKQSLKGGMKEQFAVEAGKWTKEEADELLTPIFKAGESGLVTQDSAMALLDLLGTGTLPEPRFFKEWAKVYGPEFARTMQKLVQQPPSTLDKILDVMNIPRAVMASADLSGTFRQGLYLSIIGPTKVPRAFAREIKAFLSEKVAVQMDDALRARPAAAKFIESKGYLAPMEKMATIAAREEVYASRMAEKLPFVRRSARAFNTYLNEMRVATFESVERSWTAQGAGAKELESLAHLINVASGRGNLPASLDKYMPVLNQVFFSPRLQASRLQLPVVLGQMLFSENPYMRKEAAKGLATFLGGGAALLSFLKYSDMAEVEFDPRSADFGKIKIGETRLDIWTGYLQYARFAAQMLTGESKSALGNMNKVARDELILRFLQSKASPIAGLFADLAKGENYLGEQVLSDTTGALKMAFNRLTPLAVQDMMEAFQQTNSAAPMAGAAAILGVGVLTYVNDLVIVRDKVARQAGFESWDKVDPINKRKLAKLPELQRAVLEYDRRSMGTQWGDWHLTGRAIETTFTEGVELASAEYRKTLDGPTFRDKVDKAFNARAEAYKSRDLLPQFAEIVSRLGAETIEEAMVRLGPEEMAIKTYNDALFGDDMKDEFGNYKYEEATLRREALQTTMSPEMFAYVEEARGQKYEDLPLEYHQLVTARMVMKPYWAIEGQVINIFGKPRTPYQVRKIESLISKLRKRLRQTNPAIAKAYEQFYVTPERTY